MVFNDKLKKTNIDLPPESLKSLHGYKTLNSQ